MSRLSGGTPWVSMGRKPEPRRWRHRTTAKNEKTTAFSKPPLVVLSLAEFTTEALPMPHSYAQNHVHLVFSAKKRLKIIPQQLQPRLWAYIAGICKNNNMLSFAVGGMPDHIHVLFRLPATLALIRAVTLIKSNSSKWLRKTDPRFAWQQGYGAFSVSSSHLSKVIRYIDHQEAHHQKFTFEDEFITMLKKHGIAYDPEHVFD